MATKIAICGQVANYPGCNKEKKIVGRGLCGACYGKLPEQRERIYARRKACAEKIRAIRQKEADLAISKSQAMGPASAPAITAPEEPCLILRIPLAVLIATISVDDLGRLVKDALFRLPDRSPE